MPLVPIDDLFDPRVAAYRDLKDRELARDGNRFIAEGELVVRRLLASSFDCESILCNHQLAAELSPIAKDHTPLYVTTNPVLSGVVGYKFHTGCLAVGKRHALPNVSDLVDDSAMQMLLVCPDLNNAENLGSIIRIAAGLGAAAVVIGPKSHDPFYRQCVRVSMGTIFSIRLARSDDIAADLTALNQRGFNTLAMVCHPQATPLHQVKCGSRVALVLGSEAQGLAPQTIEACNIKTTIPMHAGTDSLNVAIAAAVGLYHLATVREKPSVDAAFSTDG